MRPGLEQARDRQFGAFAAWQVLCEYTRAEMRMLVEGGEWVRVFRGVYREAVTPPVPALRVEAARLSTGLTSVAAAYETAAELHGFPVPPTPTTHVLGARPSRSALLYVHTDRAEPGELQLVRGTLTTTLPRTVIDLVRTAPPAVAGAMVDAVLARGVSQVELWAEVSRHRGRRGHAQARDLVARCGQDAAAVAPEQADAPDATILTFAEPPGDEEDYR